LGTDHIHRVCTYSEAEDAIRGHADHFVSDCFCRGPASRGEMPWEYCGHEVHNCMGFHQPVTEGVTWSRITLEEALEKMRDWREKGNFFRFMEDDDWLCFCCGCGCGFFRNESGGKVRDTCEGSPWTEKTDPDCCTLCGVCVDTCAFDARSISEGEMLVDPEACSGCSACGFICPASAIEMVPC